LDANIKFSQRTAQRYMKLYEERHDPKYATVTDLKDAYNNNDLEEVPDRIDPVIVILFEKS